MEEGKGQKGRLRVGESRAPMTKWHDAPFGIAFVHRDSEFINHRKKERNLAI